MAQGLLFTDEASSSEALRTVDDGIAQVRLPLPHPPAATSECGQSTPPCEKKRLLVVDDERSLRHGLCRALRSRYQVVDAASADDALNRIAEGFLPDLVLTDVLMPGISGLQLLDEIRVRFPALQPWTVLMSGDLMLAEEARLCCDHLLEKPVDLQALLGLIRSLLGC